MTKKSATDELTQLLDLMARLRSPDGGCPWDVEQTFASIAPHTIEEAYEVADAIERNDMTELRDELGDLLLQVVFHARMAEEDALFDFADVAAAISDKLIRRHPHVFGDLKIADAAAQTIAWEDQKAKERDRKAKTAGGKAASVLDDVARGLPALTRALKLQNRAARVGFDWPDVGGVLDKLSEEIAELRAEIDAKAPPERLSDELGDVLFSVVNLARHLKLDPETALRHGNAKFDRRFRAMEQALAAAGTPLGDLSLADMEAAWQAAKRKP